MKVLFRFILLFMFNGVPLFLFSQPPTDAEIQDTIRLKPLVIKIGEFFFEKPDSTLYYSQELYKLATQSGNYPVANYALQSMGEAYRGKANFPKCLEMQLKALEQNRAMNDQRREAHTSSFIGFIYLQLNNYRQALQYLGPAKTNLKGPDNYIQSSFNLSNTAYCYTMLGLYDSAYYFNQESYKLLDSIEEGDRRKKALRTLIYDRMGDLNLIENKLENAIQFYRLSLHYAIQDNIKINITREQKNIGKIYAKLGLYDSAIIYSWSAYHNSRIDHQALLSIEVVNTLSEIHKKMGRIDSAYYYLSLSRAIADSVYGLDKFKDLQSLMLTDQQRRQELLAEKTETRNRWRISIALVAALALLVVVFILRRNNRAKQVINQQLETQKLNLERTLAELKSTQSQLIQSEKMASLGELTAGIAHEIQNPLNFVNNFSDVNFELSEELLEAARRGKLGEVTQLATDIKSNQEKIRDHGQRADSIVKSMLQHSRISTGQKEPTDINSLCDEYLRLSYHGMRARNASFNSSFETNFDSSIGMIHIIPQDISRVLLNLFNNAFYTVNEKAKKEDKTYQPLVTVHTKNLGDKVEIRITDNGEGIPGTIKDKILQPFFTTKPTGQGTGLGLSLSYDLVKAQGGNITFETIPGEGTSFIVVI